MTLGYFWKRVFADRDTVNGLTLAQAEAANQVYYNILDMINSYSCDSIPVFEKRNWYPLHIKLSDLNDNQLTFGEGVEFGAQVASQDYVFGRPIPEETNVWSVLLPAELKGLSIIADQIIEPGNIWVNGQDCKLVGRRLYFNNNPFEATNINTQLLFNEDGTKKMYYDYSEDAEIQDAMITLWCYNALIDADYLKYNIGYLFGLNVPHSENGKEILASIVKTFTNGPTINDIKAVGLSSIGLPVLKHDSIITDIQLPGYVITQHEVYHFPAGYPLKATTTIGASVKKGDVLVEALELYDNVNKPEWWQTEFSVSDNNLPFTLPKHLLIGNYKHSLTFLNEVSPVSVDLDGNITFPVNGSIGDVKTFLNFISNADFQASVEDYLGYALDSGHSYTGMINPVDFIFKSCLKSSTALLRIKFLNMEQLSAFHDYFNAIRPTLPPHIILMVLCDIEVGNEVFELNSILDDSGTTTGAVPLTNGLQLSYALPIQSDNIDMNYGSGLLISDMGFSRVILSNISSNDLKIISLTIPS
jgi:hypothetical protein